LRRNLILKHNPIIYDIILLSRKRYNKEKAGIWKTISDILEKRSRCKISVNISRISRYLDNDKIAVVPGKVLGSGTLDKPIKVAALSFTDQAEKKIREKGGKCFNLKEIIQGKIPRSKLVIVR